jgi:plastocyanin
MRVCVASLCLFGLALCAPTAAGARVKVVYSGGPAHYQKALRRVGAGPDAYLLSRITVSAGDTIVFDGRSRLAGFHTVDLPPVGGGDLPLITLGRGLVGDRVLDARRKPFWFDGKLPRLSFSRALIGASGGHTYDGTARLDSGLPLAARPTDFRVTFTRPGTYTYFCDVHPGMRGVVVVRRKGAAVPSAAEDARTLATLERHYFAEARRRRRVRLPHNHVSVGISSPDGLERYAMFPARLKIMPGTTVTFVMPSHSREIHTATFGTVAYLRALVKAFNGPRGSIDPRGGYPSDPPGTIVLSPFAHGNGFANTGGLDADPTTPLPASATITFTKPGVYHYICLIHPVMRGTILVR